MVLVLQGSLHMLVSALLELQIFLRDLQHATQVQILLLELTDLLCLPVG